MSAVLPGPAPFRLFGPSRGSAYARWSLWALLLALVAALLVTLVWLAGRYEASQVQGRLERDTAEALGDIRSGLTRDVQNLQALQSRRHEAPAAWLPEAAALVREHREWIRLEWRDSAMATVAAVDTPFRSPAFSRMGRSNAQAKAGAGRTP